MANAILDRAETTQAWLERRRTLLGSSDAPVVAGASKWRTPLEVWLSKIEPAADRAPTVRMRMGLAAEPVIAALYSEETGYELDAPELMVHPDIEWMGASIDRLRPDGRIVELKMVGERMAHEWGEEGSDEVPEYVTIQVAHQMAVSGAQCADVAALIGDSFRIYEVPRSENMIRSLLVIEEEFWDMVRRREPPPPDWSHPTTPDLINQIYKPTGMPIVLGHDEEKMAQAYKQMGTDATQLEKDRKVIKGKIIELMGTACEASLPGGRTIRRNEVDRKAYEVAATSFTDFRILEPKKAKVSA